MSYSNKENYRMPDFCEGCPGLEGIEQPAIFRVSGYGPWPTLGRPTRENILVLADIDSPSETAVSLGQSANSCSNAAFCNEHESGTSFALGNTHESVDACTGPKETKLGPFVLHRTCQAGLISMNEHLRQKGVSPRKAIIDSSQIMLRS